jgi:PAP2 superfamily
MTPHRLSPAAGTVHGVSSRELAPALTAAVSGSTLRRRAPWAAVLLALWGAGYFLIPNAVVMRHARDLATPFDGAIPFLGWTVWIYLAGLPLIAAPLFALRAEPAFHRAARSCALIVLASSACFAAAPICSPGLREAAVMVGPDSLTAWAVGALHGIDPPGNLFPSLHVSLSALSCWSIAEAQPRWRWAWWAALALIAVSVATTKQHLLLDVVGGLALAWAVRGRSAGMLWAAGAPLALVSALFGLLYWRAG